MSEQLEVVRSSNSQTTRPLRHIIKSGYAPVALCGYRCKEVWKVKDHSLADCIVCIDLYQGGYE